MGNSGNPLLAQLKTTMPQDSLTPTPDQAAGNSLAVNSLNDLRMLSMMNSGTGAAPKIKIDPDKGTISFDGVGMELFQTLLKKSQGYDEILSGFAQEQQRIQAEARAKQSGTGAIINALTTFAGNLAASPGMNPMVQALGKTALAVNPTSDQLWDQARQIAVSTEPIRRGQADLFKTAADIMMKEEATQMRLAQESRQDYNTRLDNYRAIVNKVHGIAQATGEWGKDMEAEIRTAASQLNIPTMLADSDVKTGESAAKGALAKQQREFGQQRTIAEMGISERQRAERFTAAFPELKKQYDSATIGDKDRDMLIAMNDLEEKMARELPQLESTGGPWAGKFNRALAWLGMPENKQLIQQIASTNIQFLKATAAGNFSRLSEREGQWLLDQLPDEQTPPKLAREWFARFQALLDKQRAAIIEGRYASNLNEFARYLPATDKTLAGEPRLNWQKVIEDRDKGLNQLKREVKNLPIMVSGLLAQSGQPAVAMTPVTNPNTGGPAYIVNPRTGVPEQVFSFKGKSGLYFADGTPAPKGK